jgi:anti-anti-sigma regulatory factor
LNYQRVFDRIRANAEKSLPRVVALDLSGVMDVEYTALKMLTEAESRTREQGIELWLVGLTPEVLAVVNRSPLGRSLGRERMFHNLEQAVASYLGTSTGTRPGAPEATSSS